MNKSFSSKRFRSIGVLTIASVYFLILVGGIVRSTGSGMGCPDWPKCFGMWVPPTTLQQLPDNYLEVYKEKRILKNERIGNMLQRLGFKEVAQEIFAHPSQYIETEFNVTKTWIEYVNRLVGVVIGILIFFTVLYSLPYRKSDPKIFWGAVGSFLLVAFQGWLGSLVVSTNLLPEMVTLHMTLTLLLVAILTYIVIRAARQDYTSLQLPSNKLIFLILYVAIAVSFFQIIIGTQVREGVDVIAFNMSNQDRDSWIGQLGNIFSVHRSLSIVVVMVNVVLAFYVVQLKQRWMNNLVYGILGMIGVEALLGIVLSNYGIPAFAQPLHLLIGTLLFGLQFLLLISYFYAQKTKSTLPHLVA